MNRLKQLFHQANSIKGATIILVVTLLISNILGMLRDHFLTQKIPISILDTYYVAFRIPDFVFNLLILGAISAAFIPVFTDYIVKDKKEAWRLANSFLNIALLAIIISIIILYFVMPSVISGLVADFSEEKKQTTIHLARILLLSPLFFSLSYIISGIINSFKRFVAYSLAPLIYNLSIIISTVLFADKYGILGVVYGVIIGAFLHFLIQLPVAIKLGFRYRLVFDWADSGVKKIIKLMIPRTIGLGAMQAMLLVYTAIASKLGSGSVAMFNLADNIQTMPLVVFGTSFATAIFPSLSTSVSEKKLANFNSYLFKGIRSILFILIPSTVGFVLLRTEIVRLILGSGQFGWEQTITTANILGFFILSLSIQGLIPLLSRAFYALHDTKTPALISVLSFLISIILGYFISQQIGVTGLALAFTIGSSFNFILLYLILRKHPSIDLKSESDLFKLIAKIIVASIIMAIFLQISKGIFGSLVDMQRFWGVLVKTISSTVIATIIYLTICHYLKCEEIQDIKEIFIKKIKQNGHLNHE